MLIFITYQAQQAPLNINDKNIADLLLDKFCSTPGANCKSSVFAVYIKEKPNLGGTHGGYVLTTYQLQNTRQISDFIDKFEVYKKDDRIFYIFDTQTGESSFKELRVNRITRKDLDKNEGEPYDEPKSWVALFDGKGNIMRCLPYPCY